MLAAAPEAAATEDEELPTAAHGAAAVEGPDQPDRHRRWQHQKDALLAEYMQLAAHPPATIIMNSGGESEEFKGGRRQMKQLQKQLKAWALEIPYVGFEPTSFTPEEIAAVTSSAASPTGEPAPLPAPPVKIPKKLQHPRENHLLPSGAAAADAGGTTGVGWHSDLPYGTYDDWGNDWPAPESEAPLPSGEEVAVGGTDAAPPPTAAEETGLEPVVAATTSLSVPTMI